MPKKETPAKATTYAAPALEKGLDILELLSSVSRPMGLSDISQAVGRSKNEIFRMLHVLEKRHYIERAQGKYLYTLRSEEHTSEPHSIMRTPHAVFCLKKKK